MTHEHINPDRFADSAGVPWQGRHFESNPWVNDNGLADPALQTAIDDFATGKLQAEAVVNAFRSARLLIPLVAELGESGEGAHGQKVDKSADLSIVSVQTPDGQVGLPVFSSVAAMQVWNSQARPVPIEATRVALAAASENNTRIVLDPGSATEFVIRRPAIEAIARQLPWNHPVRNAELKALVAGAIDREPWVENFAIQDGDPGARLRGPELQVFLKLVAGVAAEQVQELVQSLGAAWAASSEIAAGVDSLGVKVVQ